MTRHCAAGRPGSLREFLTRQWPALDKE